MKDRGNIIPFRSLGEKLPKTSETEEKMLKVEKPTAEVPEKERVEQIYKELLEAYLDGVVKDSDIEDYLRNYRREVEMAEKEKRPLSEEYNEEEVRAHVRLLKEIKEGKIKRKKMEKEEVKKYGLTGLTEEEMDKLLIAAGFKKEHVETMYKGKEVLEEMIEERLSLKQIAERAEKIKRQMGKIELTEQEASDINNQAKEELRIEAIREFLASHELVVRGVWASKEEKGEKKWGVVRRTNLDGKVSLELLKLAGIDISKVKYVAPGDWERGAINLDTGYRDGFIVQLDLAEGEKEKFATTTFFDHHGVKSDSNTSSAKSIYETLVEFKFLEKTPEFDKLVEFVTQIDNLSYPEIEKYFETSDRTILGLQRFITFKNLLKYIRSGRSFTEVLSDKDLREYGFIYKEKGGRIVNRSEEQRRIIEDSKKRMKWLMDNGFIIDTRYGKIVVDIESQLKGGQWATMAEGYKGYLSYNYKKGGQGFFLALNKGKLKDLDLPQGVLVRDVMYIQPRGKEKLYVTLEDIIKKIISHDFKPVKGLKEFLSKEQAVKKQEAYKINYEKILREHPVFGEMSEEARKGFAKIWALKLRALEESARRDLSEEEFRKLWNNLLKKRKGKAFPKIQEIDEVIAEAKKELEKEAEARKREALIKKYEEILAKHPIHGREASKEDRRRAAEKLADLELKN